jgi:hypothetical protein
MAENFVSKDIIVVSVGYDLAPQVTLTEIINQVQNGFAEVLKYLRCLHLGSLCWKSSCFNNNS